MAFNIPEHCYAYRAGEDLSGKEGYAVVVSTNVADPDNSVRLATLSTSNAFLGIVWMGARVSTAPQSSTATLLSVTRSAATIQTGGIAKAVCSATVANGDPITVHTDGRLRKAVTGEWAVGTALTTTTAADDIFSFQFNARPAPMP